MSQLKNIAAMAATLVAASAVSTAALAQQQGCGAGTCAKKETTKPADGKDAACSKKDGKKDAAKEAACAKK